jgi:hypothetical protein
MDVDVAVSVSMNGGFFRKRGQNSKFDCALVGAIPPHVYESLSALSQAYYI